MWKPESNGNLQALTKINYQSRCPRTIKIFFKNEDEINNF